MCVRRSADEARTLGYRVLRLALRCPRSGGLPGACDGLGFHSAAGSGASALAGRRPAPPSPPPWPSRRTCRRCSGSSWRAGTVIPRTWPTLRDEMVARLGAGDSFDDIVADFERRHGNDVAQLPSMRTFRRWRDERSDLESPPSDAPVECTPERARSTRRPASPPARRPAATSPSAGTLGRRPLGRGDERRSTARPMSPAPQAARPPPREG